VNLTQRTERLVQIRRANSQIDEAGQNHISARPAHAVEP
jgi:hypothetical protein